MLFFVTLKPLLLALSLLLAAPAPKLRPVYVCQSATSYAYHRTPYCEGLYRCTHPVKPLREAAAVKLGKHKCYLCWYL